MYARMQQPPSSLSRILVQRQIQIKKTHHFVLWWRLPQPLSIVCSPKVAQDDDKRYESQSTAHNEDNHVAFTPPLYELNRCP